MRVLWVFLFFLLLAIASLGSQSKNQQQRRGKAEEAEEPGLLFSQVIICLGFIFERSLETRFLIGMRSGTAKGASECIPSFS